MIVLKKLISFKQFNKGKKKKKQGQKEHKRLSGDNRTPTGRRKLGIWTVDGMWINVWIKVMRKLREREMGERKIQTSSCARLEIRKKERMKRRKLWKGGQSKRKNTLKVKAVALTNRPYGSVAAEPQGATRFVCVCVCVCVCVWEGERWICIVFCQTSGCQQFASLAHYSQGRQLTWIMHSYTHIHTHTHTHKSRTKT